MQPVSHGYNRENDNTGMHSRCSHVIPVHHHLTSNAFGLFHKWSVKAEWEQPSCETGLGIMELAALDHVDLNWPRVAPNRR